MSVLDLFSGALPAHPARMRDDEARLLATLPSYGILQEVQMVRQEDEAACRRLEVRGLVKVHRWKDDPISARPTMYAGKLEAAPTDIRQTTRMEPIRRP